MKMQINKKVIYYLYKYTLKTKLLNKLGFKLLNNIYSTNNLIKLNYEIKNFNNKKYYKKNLYKLLNICNTKNKYYLKFKKEWIKNKNNIKNKFGYYIKSKDAYIYLFLFLKKNIKNNTFKISSTNFIIKLSKILKNLIINDKTKYINKHIYLSYLIYNICIKIKWLKTKLILKQNKKQYFIEWNSYKFLDVIMQVVNESIQFPYLIKPKLNKNKKLKEFNYNKTYENTINYLNSQKIIINKDYLQYLLDMDINQLFILTDKNVDLSVLDKKQNCNKDIEKVINAFKYLLNIYMVYKYRNKSFYFDHFYDWRGRIYQKSWPMNSLYTKITSPLFIFNNCTYNIKYYYNKFDTIFWYKAYNINPFRILDVRDATNSMFQIAACLTYDINLLKYTNIHNENVKYNIYDYILYEIKSKINDLLNNIGYIYINDINKIDKDFIKKLIMPWSYNENTKTGIKKICNFLFKEYITEYNFQDYFKKSSQIYVFIFKIFNEKFKFYNVLKNFLNILSYSICQNNKNIIINHNKSNTHNFIQTYYTEINKVIYIGHFDKKKKHLNIKIIDKNKVSIKDNKRALIANTIQYLDSVILTQVILKCKEKDIPILTNHDCFYTTIKHGENVLKIYNECLYEYIIDYDFLNDLIIENNIDFNSKEKHIKKLKNIYQEILDTRNKNKEYINKIDFNNIKYSISLGKNYDLVHNIEENEKRNE